MLNRVRKFMISNQMVRPGDRILVGVSGGADSICLLHVLYKLKDELDFSLVVVHVNHCLRGEEADLEEAYVKEFCEERNITIVCVKKQVKAYAKEQGISLEEAGRIIRYSVFQEECNRFNCHKIAIAHNKNDNAETTLFHLFRGSGVDGACGIAPVRDNIIRPILMVTRAEIEEYLKIEQIHFCTDSSNLTLDYTRNKIRHQILPYAVEEINEKAVEHIAAFANQMSQISRFLNNTAKNVFEKTAKIESDCVSLDIDLLRKEDPIIIQSVVKLAIELVSMQKKDIEAIHILSVCELISKQSGREIHLPHHIIASRGYNNLIVARSTEKEILTPVYEIANIPGTLYIESLQLHFTFELITNRGLEEIPKCSYTKWFDYDKIRDTVVVRTKQQGDFLQIHRAGGTKSLKSLLIEKKIPKEKREAICLLASGSHVLWAPGVRTSEAFLVDDNTTTILSVTLENENK